MTFQELQQQLDKLSPEQLKTKVTAFSKYWWEEERDILLSFDGSDGNSPYFYVVTDREKKESR